MAFPQVSSRCLPLFTSEVHVPERNIYRKPTRKKHVQPYGNHTHTHPIKSCLQLANFLPCTVGPIKPHGHTVDGKQNIPRGILAITQHQGVGEVPRGLPELLKPSKILESFPKPIIFHSMFFCFLQKKTNIPYHHY